MDLGAGSSRSKNKGKSKTVQGEDAGGTTKQTRDPNFNEDDTTLLLHVMEMVKDLFGLKNYGFKKAEWGRVEAIYNDKIRTKRVVEVLKNRWKTLRADFGTVKALSNRTGWRWNHRANFPIPPSEKEWDLLVESDQKRYGKFKTKGFPWFDKLENMCGDDIATGYGQVTTESSRQVRHEWCDAEENEANLNDDYGTDPIADVRECDAMDARDDMGTQNAANARDVDAAGVGDVTDVGETNHIDDNEDVDAYDISNFLRTFNESGSHTTPNDGRESNSGHTIGVSDKCKERDIGRGTNSRAKRFKAAAVQKQRAVDKIVEQNGVLIEQNNTFLEQQQARTNVFNAWGINCQHKIPSEIDVKLKSLDPKLSTDDYLDIRAVLRNPAARDDFLSLEDAQIWDFVLKNLRQYRAQNTPFNPTFNPYMFGSQSGFYQQPPI